MFSKLDTLLVRYKEIESRLSDSSLQPDELKKLSVEHAQLAEMVAEYQNYKQYQDDLRSSKTMLMDQDSGLVALAKDEIKDLEQKLVVSAERLKIYLLPKDERDEKNIILEIRAGAGGDEAGLFAGELYRAYHRYAENQGWKVTLLSAHATGIGGFKEIISEIQGTKVFSRLKWEAGVHRVQRVPDTETQGRVHTSTITVAVLPEAEEVDVNIQPTDLRIDVFRSGGAGGQSVNTTDSAVRITHIPSGLVVSCQDERSQHKNKDRALKILRSRLYDMEQERAHKAHADTRRSMVGTGDRSERIRTYNFPQGRLTDHRIGLTIYQLPEVMQGKLDSVIDPLIAHFQIEALKASGIG